MGIELLEIGDKMRKAVIFTIRRCLRSVYNHPFLVGFVCFLILLYRSSPFIFSLLVSASPILLCTAVLLGVLLSYGEPNIPEIEIEDKTTFDSVPIKTGLLGDSTVVDQNGTYFVERLIDDHLDDTAPLIKERSLEIESNGGEIWEENGDLGDSGHGPDEKLKDEAVKSEDEKSEADSFDSETVNVDSLDSPPRSPWTRIEEREDDVRADEEDEFTDSGSDRAESSSPDASMADIMPMLDELHPLLDEEPPQPVHASHSGSDVASEKSLKSDDESENQDDDNEEDDAHEEKEEMKKSAITWTEEDQKNLMDLGSSEIERNQRLENLILRRRARKNMSIVPERNLIDLDSTDYQLSSLAPISTRRQNPFDSPRDDSYSNSGLPPIPGSAPSVLLPRRNPFDIPYDSNEEKPDLMEDGFKEEFATSVQSRDAIFRRHESFNVGPSIFGPNRKDVKMRPYFVPEGSVSEESSYSSSFQRQSSELSESKVSSVPETESISSVEPFEGPLEDPHPISHQEEDEIRDSELISEIENVPELVGHGSQSSEDEYSVEVQIDDVADRDQLESVTEFEASDEHVNRSDSSSSSLSEVSEQVFTELESEGLPILEERRDFVNILRQASTESSNLSVSGSLVVEVPHQAPVYDSSPRGVRRDVPSSLEILPDLSVTHPIDQPHPVGANIFEHENVIVDFSEVEKEIEIDVSKEGQFEINEPLFEGQLRDERAIGVEERETVQLVDEKLISNTSVEGNAYPFHDASDINEPSFQYLDEVQASIALVEPSGEAQITQNLNRPEIQELDHDIPSDIISPSSHEFISDLFVATETTASSHEFISDLFVATETTDSLFNAQTTIEEVDGIKEIDEDILSELDNVGDFSVQQWVSGSSGFERHMDSVEENKKIEDLIDIHKEGVEYNISELQTSETTGSEHIDNVSNMEINKKDGPDCKTSENETLSEEENEAQPVSKADIDFVSKKAEMTLPETEVSKIENVDMAFKETLAEHSENSSVAWSTHETSVLEVRPIEKDAAALDAKQSLSDSVDCDLHLIELGETLETISELDVAKKNTPSEDTILPTEENEARHVRSVVSCDYGDNISETPELEVQSKDVEFVSRKEFNERDSLDSKMPENKTLLEEVNEARPFVSVVSPVYGDNISEIPELGVQSREDVDVVSRKEFNERDGPDSKTSKNETLPEEENEARPVCSVVNISEIPESEMHSDEAVDFVSKKYESSQGQADTETTNSQMPELQASKIKDIEQAFKEIISKEITVDFETLDKEALAEQSENSNVVGSTHETLVLEVGLIEKDDDATMDSKQSFSDSVVSEETQGTFAGSNAAEKNVPSEETILPPNDKVLNGESLKQLKPNSDDELVGVEADKVGSSVVESRVEEISVTAEKSDHGVEAPKDHLTASVKGKGKSSSSSSSSSSDSSSSDSERD